MKTTINRPHMVKKALIMGFFSLLLVSTGCHPSNNQNIYTRGQIQKLEQILKRNTKKEGKITPGGAIDSIIELYKSQKTTMESKEDPIDLYVLYDLGHWSIMEESETFEITFAHQVVEESFGPLWEYRITLSYAPEAFQEIEGFTLNYPHDKEDLEEFKNAILLSEGYKKASAMEPRHIEMIKEKI